MVALLTGTAGRLEVHVVDCDLPDELPACTSRVEGVRTVGLARVARDSTVSTAPISRFLALSKSDIALPGPVAPNYGALLVTIPTS